VDLDLTDSQMQISLPPRIREVLVDDQDYVETLGVAKKLAQRGCITVVRGFSSNLELLDVLAVLGPIFEPVALPPDKSIAPTTVVSEAGFVASSINWHYDQSFAHEPPTWSALYCDHPGTASLPSLFADGAGLVSLLSDGFRDMLRRLMATHEAYYSLEAAGSSSTIRASHPVIQLVEGKVEALFVSPATVERFMDWSLQDSFPVLERLFAMMNWPEITVAHYWQEGDLLLWPNRRYLHRALPLDAGPEPRQLRRVVGRWAA